MTEVVLSAHQAKMVAVVLVLDPIQWLYVDPPPYFSDEL